MRLLFTNLVIFLLLTGIFAAAFDCPTDACFGQPEGCIPGQNCRFVFKFDEEGNLDLYLRDFVDLHAYAAFPLGEEANQTYTYLICLPHAQKRMRAIAKLGQPIVVSEYEMARTVRKIGDNDFACSFPASELTESFQHDRNFFITTGQFVANLVINDGEQLYSFESKEDFEEDADYEPIYTEPVSGNIKRTARITDDVYTVEEKKQADDAIDVVEKIANNKKHGSDLEEDIESAMNNKKKQSSRRQEAVEEDGEVENSDEEDFEQEVEKITRRSTRGNRQSTSRRSSTQNQDQNEEENDEDEDWEATAKQLEKKEKKSTSRRGNFEEDDEETRPSKRNRKQYEEDEDEDEDRRKRRIPKRKSRKDEDDDEEEEDDEEFDEDEDDAAAANFDIFLFSSFIIIAFGFVL